MDTPESTSDPLSTETFNAWFYRVAREPETHYVYKLFNAAGDVLYVGRTSGALKGRLREHYSKREWAREQVVRCTTEKYKSRKDASLAERYAIATLKPRYNKIDDLPEKQIEVVRRYLDGASTPELSNELDMPAEQVEQILSGDKIKVERVIVDRVVYREANHDGALHNYETCDQAGKRLNASRRMVQRWAKEGRLPAIKVGRDWLIAPGAEPSLKRRRKRQ